MIGLPSFLQSKEEARVRRAISDAFSMSKQFRGDRIDVSDVVCTVASETSFDLLKKVSRAHSKGENSFKERYEIFSSERRAWRFFGIGYWEVRIIFHPDHATRDSCEGYLFLHTL